jgi:hypothetical protein
MVKCSICETETQLYVAGNPLCVGCAKRLQWSPRQHIENVLNKEPMPKPEPKICEGNGQ